VGELDAEQEFYIDFDEELFSLTEELLEEHKKEANNYMNSIECQCTWQFCPDHNDNKLDIFRWLNR
jgi:hypothetical protein